MSNSRDRSATCRQLLMWLLVVSAGLNDVIASPRPENQFCPQDVNSTIDCSRVFSCHGNCGALPTKHSGVCGCDKDCELYGDCCHDYGDCVTKPTDQSAISLGQCRYTHYPYQGAVHMFISDCHPDWQGDETRERCQNTSSSLLSLLPVTDNDNLRIYSNVFCAVCNFAASNLTPWTADAKCFRSDRENGTSDELSHAINSKQCGIVLKYPKTQGVAPRRCATMLTTQCDARCRSEELRDKCEASPVMSPTVAYSRTVGRDMAYKNEYCAKCNGVNFGDIACMVSSSFYTPNLGQFSFAVLVDFHSSGCVFTGGDGRTLSCKVRDRVKMGEHRDASLVNATHPEACNETDDPDQNCTDFSSTTSSRMFVSSPYSEWLGILTLICISASVVCLVARLVLHFFIPCFQTLGGRTQFCLCLSLLVAMVTFILGPLVAEVTSLCEVVAVTMHWSFLSSFFWMNVIAVDMWLIFRPASSFSIRSLGKQRRLLAGFCLYGWLAPFLIVFSALCLDLVGVDSQVRPYYGVGVCWIAQKYALVLFFAVPVGVIIVANIVLYVITARHLYSSMASVTPADGKNSQLGVYVRLFILMGSAWITAYVATFVGSDVMWAIYIVLTSTQGVYISLAAILTRQVRNALCGKPDAASGQRTQRTSVFSISFGSRSKSVTSATMH